MVSLSTGTMKSPKLIEEIGTERKDCELGVSLL